MNYTERDRDNYVRKNELERETGHLCALAIICYYDWESDGRGDDERWWAELLVYTRRSRSQEEEQEELTDREWVLYNAHIYLWLAR